MARQKGPCTGHVLRRPLLWLAGLLSVSIPPSRPDTSTEKQPPDLLLRCLIAHCRCTINLASENTRCLLQMKGARDLPAQHLEDPPLLSLPDRESAQTQLSWLLCHTSA